MKVVLINRHDCFENKTIKNVTQIKVLNNEIMIHTKNIIETFPKSKYKFYANFN